MKKRSLILLPAMMLLVACGPTDQSTSTTPTTTTTTSGVTPVKVDYGSLESPLTVTKFLEEAGKLELENGSFSEKHFFVEGVAQTYFAWNNTYKNYDKFKLGETKTSETKIDVTGMQRGEGIDDVYQGDTFVVEGLAEKYEDELCIYFNKKANDYPLVQKLVSRGESTVSFVTVENGKVEGLLEKYENGKTAEFTVTADTGFKVVSVEVYSKEIAMGEDGKYNFRVMGDATIKVTTQSKASTEKIVSIEIAATSFIASEDKTSATFSKDGVDFVLEKNESTNALRLTDTNHLRIYKNAKFTIKLSGVIKKITFTSSEKDSYNDYYPFLVDSTFTGAKVDKDSSSEEDFTVTVLAETDVKEISFVATAGQVRLVKAVITYEPTKAPTT